MYTNNGTKEAMAFVEVLRRIKMNNVKHTKTAPRFEKVVEWKDESGLWDLIWIIILLPILMPLAYISRTKKYFIEHRKVYWRKVK